jgi:thymidine phosphorylase
MTGQALRLRRLGIDTLQEHVVYMRRDCHVCRAEGFDSLARLEVECKGRHLIATLNVVDGELLARDEAGLSLHAAQALDGADGDALLVRHAPTLDSLSALRSKIYGHRLSRKDLAAIIGDVVQGHYADIHIAAFLSACAGGRMDIEETVELTRVMVEAGEVIDWGRAPVLDKHCVGGLPGNRTSPIVVAIVAAAGQLIPKTSSRAITSPAGTADVMETMTRVDLDLTAMRRVVDAEGACLAWGGALALSPADDALIRVERPLDLDSDAQLVASVLSKKIAAGATHALIDVPVGPTAKVRTAADAQALQLMLERVATSCGLAVRVLCTDGSQPVGRGVGPSLEARDVLAVLRNEAAAPADLKARAVLLAGELLEFGGGRAAGQGRELALQLLQDGSAWRKFQAICTAQGGLRMPGIASLRQQVIASRSGYVAAIDSRRLARTAKLAGAPTAPTAGIELHVRLGERVARGQGLLTLHAEAPGELGYALQYAGTHPAIYVSDEMTA